MRDSQPFFDHEAEAKADLTREFWGERTRWATGSQRQADRRAFQVRPADEVPPEYRLDHTPTSMRAVRDGIAAFRPKRRWRGDVTGPIERTRQHGTIRHDTVRPSSAGPIEGSAPDAPRRPAPERLVHRDATIADLAAGKYDDVDRPIRPSPAPASARLAGQDDDLIPLTPVSIGDRLGIAGVDPLVVRLGIVLLVVLLALPVAFALRGGDDPRGGEGIESTVPAPDEIVVGAGAGGAPETPTPLAAAPVAEQTSAGADASTTDSARATTATEATPASGETSVTAELVVTGDEAATSAGRRAEGDHADSNAASNSVDTESVEPSAAAAVETAEAGAVEAAEVDESAERIAPDCSLDYTAAPGDSWYRIADAAGVRPADLLAQNMAGLDTVILPGDQICLPPGATVPAPPTTAAPTTAAPTTTAATPTTTTAPTTTVAPTTTDAPVASYSRAEVQALIREVWPDDQEERALEIARRESNYIASADNGWCCVGVFQLYWTVHQSWLDDYGIDSRSDLKDARKNITAAYALYQRSGGWGPWGG